MTQIKWNCGDCGESDTFEHQNGNRPPLVSLIMKDLERSHRDKSPDCKEKVGRIRFEEA